MSNHVNPNMSNREVADFTLVDFKTKQPWLNVDFANVTTTEMAATRVLAKGGRGAAPRVPFDGERTCTMKVDTQITPMKLFAMLAGTEILTSGKVFTRERLTLAAGKLTLSEEPVANSVTVYKADDDCGAAISATVAEKAATIEDGSDGDEYIVYYMANKEQGIQIVKFKSDVFPKAYTAYGETLYKTEDDELLPMKLVIHKAVPQAAFSLALSNTGDPSRKLQGNESVTSQHFAGTLIGGAFIHNVVRQHVYVLPVHTGSFGYFQLFQVAGEGGLCQFEAFAVQLLQQFFLRTDLLA